MRPHLSGSHETLRQAGQQDKHRVVINNTFQLCCHHVDADTKDDMSAECGHLSDINFDVDYMISGHQTCILHNWN